MSDTPASPSARSFFRIVCTGGPCGGKTTALSSIAAALKGHGLTVYMLPETPTILQNAGFRYPGMDGGELLEEFEYALFAVQKEIEDASTRVALCEQRVKASDAELPPVCLLLDRGLLDMRGYMQSSLWHRILERAGLSEADVLSRYDAVIHLVTAADGAVEHYTLSNNTARTETVAEALQNDARVWEAWSIHPNRVRVDNSHGSFARKVAVTCEHAIGFVREGGSPRADDTPRAEGTSLA